MEFKEIFCQPIDKATKPFSFEQVNYYISNLVSGWDVIEGKIITKAFLLENFENMILFPMMLQLFPKKKTNFLKFEYVNVSNKLNHE